MKQLLIRLLNRLGLVPARRYTAVVGRLRETEDKSRKVSKQLEEMRGESRAWKDKANEAVKKLAELERNYSQQQRQAEKVKAKEDKRIHQDVERAKRAAGDLDDLRKRLADAERELSVARELLMAVDVKLDILEGAANVLDARTRAAIRQPGETGVPV